MKTEDPASFPRLPTGIPGLDLLTQGGFLKGGVYLIMGAPGTGKTIIANQLAFNTVAQGGRALYVTLLAETHARMFGNLKPFSFFDENVISESINYLGAYSVLEREGLDGLLKMLGEAIRKFKATTLFIDGVASVEDVAQTALSFKKFVHQLNSVLSISGCTTFLLSSMDTHDPHPEHTMVDGIVSLNHAEEAMRNLRQIEVRKFRGSNHLKGRHLMCIADNGINVFPRIESYLGKPLRDFQSSSERRAFGVMKLDEMLNGGLMSGTTTSLLGPAGSGKTTFGAQFLSAGAATGEPGLYYGFYEPPNRWVRKHEGLGIDLARHVKSGIVQALWQSQTEHYLDEVVNQILSTVKEYKIKRLFIDGVGGLREGMFGVGRLHRALAALSNELRALDVTTLLTEETEVFASEISAPISDLSAVTDNIFFFRQVEVDSELRRVFSIIKTRDFESEHRVHEFTLSERGIRMEKPFRNLESLMQGTAHAKPSARSGPTRNASRPLLKKNKGSARKKK
jgi:circadian clock protein KaiC